MIVIGPSYPALSKVIGPMWQFCSFTVFIVDNILYSLTSITFSIMDNILQLNNGTENL